MVGRNTGNIIGRSFMVATFIRFRLQVQAMSNPHPSHSIVAAFQDWVTRSASLRIVEVIFRSRAGSDAR